MKQTSKKLLLTVLLSMAGVACMDTDSDKEGLGSFEDGAQEEVEVESLVQGLDGVGQLQPGQVRYVGHDRTQSISENYDPNSLRSRYAPTFYIAAGSCFPRSAFSANGEVGGGLQDTGAMNGNCGEAQLHSTNTYVYEKNYERGVKAIVYALYFPKDGYGTADGHRHDWERVIVWFQYGQPLAVTYGQHKGHFTLRWWAVPKDVYNGSAHPVAYVGKTKHGMYNSPNNGPGGYAENYYFSDTRNTYAQKRTFEWQVNLNTAPLHIKQIVSSDLWGDAISPFRDDQINGMLDKAAGFVTAGVEDYACKDEGCRRSPGDYVAVFTSRLNRSIDVWGYPDHQRDANQKLVSYYKTGSEQQQWNVIPWMKPMNGQYGEDVYQLRNRKSGMCMDIRDMATGNGTLVTQWPCKNVHSDPNANSQLWRRDRDRWINVRANRCLDTRNNSAAPNTDLMLYDCNWTAGQAWLD
jgi:Necrosis inducing protein (NPP1)/Ricin-type beta-trefoil lectin domain-like